MIDSTNPRQLADNIRKLWDKFKSISGDLLPSRSTATTGQILKLTGETKTPAWADEYSYTPPAYSETETATGQKWIDGKEIYRMVFDKTTDSNTGNEILGNIGTGMNAIALFSYYYDKDYPNFQVLRITNSVFTQNNNGNVTVAKASTLTETEIIAIVYYTKPDPTPGRAPEDPEQEPEPEEKKITKKKTTTK